ncbi:tripartite tricarboxylate transporter TctB family protein [Ottowia sp.]|uniref:tripartite tricarboxylate transporter TctB family protein n=1 Tax=Ottowia sp. TaxID=1898956 RepID=UPI003A89F01C
MSDRILGVACVAIGAAMAYFAQGYAAEISYEPVGPRAFPLLLGGLLAAGGLWLAIQPSFKDNWLKQVPLVPLSLSVVAVFAYAFLFETLGFTIATALMALPVGMAFGGSWKQALAGGLGLGLVLYLLFDKLLDVVLPTGLLSFVFGGR